MCKRDWPVHDMQRVLCFLHADPTKKLLSDTASLSSESDHEGPPSNVSTTEIPPPSELKEEGIACSIVADPPPYSEHMPPPPAVGDPVWGKPPIATGATQQPGTTVMVVRRWNWLLSSGRWHHFT